MIITIMRVMRMNFDNGYDHCLFSAQRHELQKRHKELLQGCQTKPHNLPIVEVQIEREKEVLNYNDEIHVVRLFLNYNDEIVKLAELWYIYDILSTFLSNSLHMLCDLHGWFIVNISLNYLLFIILKF